MCSKLGESFVHDIYIICTIVQQRTQCTIYIAPRTSDWNLSMPPRQRSVSSRAAYRGNAALRRTVTDSESQPALVCVGCNKAFVSLRSFNGHHSSPYVKPECQGRKKGVEQGIQVTARDIRVISREIVAPEEDRGGDEQEMYTTRTYTEHIEYTKRT